MSVGQANDPGERETRSKHSEFRTFDKSARLVHGDLSRFGMVKGSIAARKATAAAAAGTGARTMSAIQNGNIWQPSPNVPVFDAKGSVAHELSSTSIQRQFPSSDDGNVTIAREPAASTARVEHQRENQERDILLGPLGSFLEIPTVSSAADLIRTASHDSSSQSVSQTRGLRPAKVSTVHSKLSRTAYYRPSDRIGRHYTWTAAALTCTSAQLVAKAAVALAVSTGDSKCGKGRTCGSRSCTSPGGLGGKSVTAPLAAESRQILHDLALLPASSRENSLIMPLATPSLLPLTTIDTGKKETSVSTRQRPNQSPSPTESSAIATGMKGAAKSSLDSIETAEHPEGDVSVDMMKVGPGSNFTDGERDDVDHGSLPIRLPQSPGHESGAKVAIPSAQQTRTNLRDKRSPPRGKRTLDASPSSRRRQNTTARESDGGYAAKDFHSWHPACLDGTGGEREVDAAVAGRDDCQGRIVCGGSRRGLEGREGRMEGSLAQAEKQRESIARYWTQVESRIVDGSPNALGAGSMSKLFELPPVRKTRSVSDAGSGLRIHGKSDKALLCAPMQRYNN